MHDDMPTLSDEANLGHCDGYMGQKCRPMIHADPSYARAYREGYLSGRRERAAGVRVPALAELADLRDADIPW